MIQQQIYIFLTNRIISKQFKNKLNNIEKTIYLKYKTSEKSPWILLAKDIDAAILSTKEAGGFVGTYLGMYASSNHF